MSKILGILGGMGPLASVDLQLRIIQNTDAKGDGDHLHVITDCNGKIPDRTQALLYGGESPLPEMIQSVRTLERAGAEFLVMACHTAHCFLEEVQKQTPLPFLSMVETSFAAMKELGVKKICILSTRGSAEVGLYDKECKKRGIEPLGLTSQEQDFVMEIIYGVKAGILDQHEEKMELLLERKRKEGAELFLLACTELPLYFRHHQFQEDLLDATDVFAREILLYAGAPLKQVL